MSFYVSQKSINAQVKSPLKRIINAGALSTLATALCFSPSTFAQQVSGVVLNKQGQAIKNALVELGSDLQTSRSNSQGIFSFSNVKEGVFELHISAKNYGHSNQQVIIQNTDVTDLNIVLSTSVMEVIDVHATPLHTSSIESALPINVLSADELKMKQAATLGETLKNEVGVHSSYYGSVASTPIIRGLDGPRVLITQNGLDVGDASRVGPDHVVATETSTATQIEVLRGPATLFYGSGAIGGVVNVVDNRVPTSSDEQVDYLLQYNDVSNEQQASINIQTGTDNVAFHLDGFWRDSKDYKLAGEADSHGEEHSEHSDEGHNEHGKKRLENSSSTASGATFGSSYLLENGFIGFSYGFMNREYGIPGHSHAEEHDDEHSNLTAGDDEQEGVYAKMQQDRWQVLGEYNFDQQFISKVSTKFAYSDYQHQEIESGLVGTTFTNKSTEARIDLFHQNTYGWQGAWTLHYKSSDFKAMGEEAFSPPAKSEMFAAAWLEEKHFGPVLLQLGARIEQVNIDADDSLIGFEDSHQDQHGLHNAPIHNEHHETLISFEQQSFTPISASAGLVWDYQSGYNLGFSMALSQRAASSGELFSFGPHIGTNTFEVGAMFDVHQEGDEIHIELAEQAPSVETSLNFDLTLRKFNGDFGYVVSAFYNRIDNYYYQQDTGLFFVDDHGHAHTDQNEDESGLPILVYQQDDVEMYGAEAEFIYQVTSAVKTSLIADYIRARLVNEDENDNLPRIPPMRIGAIMNYQADKFDTELSISHYFEQEDIAELETSTDSYTMVDAHVNYYIAGVGDDLTLYLKGQNLTNEHARVHSSFLKEVAPLPGRNFSLGIRGSF
ncbi:TonB-dependent receptor [Colwellia psychrerythraea]|uniref:TonB-dependent receptor plug n=1 Tax=Colwellia psychrerythraea TaxID=28229 RepID=A0A099KNQ7_COLPS|nr:TonB-dependent receptor [Colwellia psychrerythraea]KGJ91273.1 TonB-dependent receptor plug [Colwellia psychrerythraea]